MRIAAVRPSRTGIVAATAMAMAGIVWVASGLEADVLIDAAGPVKKSTYSSNIAVSSDDKQVWVCNPDNNSVTAINVFHDANSPLGEITVGKEPQSIAIMPNRKKVYVTNAVDGTVSVIDYKTRRVLRTVAVGTEPWACALTPDGKKLYVANLYSDTVTVIATSNDRVLKTIPTPTPKPRAIAITADNGNKGKVFVAHFQAQLRNDGRTVQEKEGRDDGKDGRVTVLSRTTDTVLGTTVLNPLADTGFKSNGSILDNVTPKNDGNGQPIFDFTTGAFPNQIQSIVLNTANNKLYVPSIGASPNGPVRFNVNMHSLISVIDANTNTDAGLTVNIHKGVQFEPTGTKLFMTNPAALAFRKNGTDGFLVSAATNRVVKVQLDATGKPTINPPAGAGQPSGVVRIPVGRNPRGIVINNADTRAYVMNFISRDVSVVDLVAGSATELDDIADIPAASLPVPGSLDDKIHHGHELFVTSTGPTGTQDNALAPAGRMSDFGWGSCYSCHNDGLTDGVTWMFGDGPRQTIPLSETFIKPQPPGAQVNENGAPILPSFKQRVLNWSAVRDEVQDFELNTRNVSGGQGLIRKGDGSVDPDVFNLVIPAGNPAPANHAVNTGRDADLDQLAAWQAFGVRAPISPLRTQNVATGRGLFAAANCQSCHGGAAWTRGIVDFTPPPVAETITGGQLQRFLFQVGSFNPNQFNEKRPVGATIVTANGALGFNIPSLVSVFASAPYFHDGSAQTLDEVMLNVTHRSAGTNGTDTLTNPAERLELVKFLKSIQTDTAPFP